MLGESSTSWRRVNEPFGAVAQVIRRGWSFWRLGGKCVPIGCGRYRLVLGVLELLEPDGLRLVGARLPHGYVRGEDLPARRRSLQPLGDVHRVAEHCVVQSPWAAESSCDHRPGVDSDPNLERRKTLLYRLLIEGHLPTLHGGRADQRPARVIGTRTGRAEDRHHRVAGELVQHATVAGNDLDHGLQVAPDRVDDLPWREPFGQRGEPTDVG